MESAQTIQCSKGRHFNESYKMNIDTWNKIHTSQHIQKLTEDGSKNWRPEAVKLQEEDIVETLEDSGEGDDFWIRPPKLRQQLQNQANGKCNKLRSLCTAKGMINTRKTHTAVEKIFNPEQSSWDMDKGFQ